jgi:hypothetical protein
MTTDFHKEALAEYQNSAAYSQNAFGLGEEFVQAVERAMAAISSDPARYKPAGNNLHDFRLERFPFHLFYLHVPGTERVTILAVAHTSRRPGYWKSRIPPLP